MRRPSPEWLLAPVFALPLLAAAGFALWARADYFDGLRRFRADGGRIARRWAESFPRLLGDAAADVAAQAPRADDDGWAPFRAGELSGFVRVPTARAPQAPWGVASDYAAGLTAAALAASDVRIAVEAGAPPAGLAGADAATTAFRDVLETNDAALLRSAPLPASTKRYLLGRVLLHPPTEDDAALATLGRLVAALPPNPRPGAYLLNPGIAFVGGGTALVYDDERDAREAVPDRAVELHLDIDDPDDLVRLLWPYSQDRAEDVVWRGRLDAPLAGEWSFVAPHGDRWWEAGAATRWVLPAAAACVAFLFVPTALLVSLRRRRKLDEARARFVNELAHDLRTPVTSLRLHAEMLAEGRVPAGGEARYLDVLGRETARLSSLLANLLDLSRVERGAREYEVHALDVGEMLRDAVRDFAAIHPKRAADVTLDAADGLAANADRTALARCLANLLDNAGKFTEPGTSIRVSATSADGRARIVVADDGPGVAMAERARVFELYERGAASRNGAPGTGLGLALVRELVQGMGGRVRLLDVPRGAAFEIDLPEADA